MSTDAKYPHIEVQLSGTDGNAMSVIARVSGALRRAVSQKVASEFAAEAIAGHSGHPSGDYGNVLQVAQRWVTATTETKEQAR